MTGIYRERLRPSDPRLGRFVHHDERSRAYPFLAAPRLALRSVSHQRHVPIYDQGALGSCTGMAAVGCMATGGYHATVNTGDADWLEPLDSTAAVHCYSEATKVDPWPGSFPPDDTGSDGLSVAKVLTAAGAISGYRHAFTLTDALAALMDQPVITGTWWTDAMFDPDSEGIVHPTGRDAGGHEYVMVELNMERGLVGFDNSWGRWGLNGTGRFYMPVEEYGALLNRDGDVTVFVPATEPAPVPVPEDTADADDERLWDDVEAWAARDSRMYRKVRASLRTWATAKGLQ